MPKLAQKRPRYASDLQRRCNAARPDGAKHVGGEVWRERAPKSARSEAIWRCQQGKRTWITHRQQRVLTAVVSAVVRARQ